MYPFLQIASLATHDATKIPEGNWVLREGRKVVDLETSSIAFVTVLAYRLKAEDYRGKRSVIVHDNTSPVFIDIHDAVAAHKTGVAVGHEVLLIMHLDGSDTLVTYFSPAGAHDWFSDLLKTIGGAGLPDGCLRLESGRLRFSRKYTTAFERTNMIFTATNMYEREVNDFRNPPPLSIEDVEWHTANRLRRMLDDAEPAEREAILKNLRRELKCGSTSACEGNSVKATESFVCPKTGKPCGTAS